jgi:hypothetical protein
MISSKKIKTAHPVIAEITQMYVSIDSYRRLAIGEKGNFSLNVHFIERKIFVEQKYLIRGRELEFVQEKLLKTQSKSIADFAKGKLNAEVVKICRVLGFEVDISRKECRPVFVEQIRIAQVRIPVSCTRSIAGGHEVLFVTHLQVMVIPELSWQAEHE